MDAGRVAGATAPRRRETSCRDWPDLCGSKARTIGLHAIDLVGGEHCREEVALFDADAVFAGDRATHFHTHFQDRAGECFGALERARFATAEHDERMQIAIACMKSIGDAHAGGANGPSSPMRRNASPKRRRGTTPSCTRKSGGRRPTALKALLRPFQMARRSAASRAGALRSAGWRR